jgi:hypothetical protein
VLHPIIARMDRQLGIRKALITGFGRRLAPATDTRLRGFGRFLRHGTGLKYLVFYKFQERG